MFRKRHRAIVTLFAAALATGLFHGTQATAQTFGKNKVQYRQFDWRVASSQNFDVYFYSGGDSLAAVVLDLAEQAAVKLTADLGHRLQKKVPIIVYGSQYDFQQTNVVTELLEEGVGGFTELFKNRVVVPFTGSYEDLRHVVVHELVHAYVFDMMFGGVFNSILSAQYLYQIPLWFNEGLAEYESLGWDETLEMVVRDAAVSGYAVSLDRLGESYLTYKMGQSAIGFLVQRHGPEKLKEILKNLRINKNIDHAFERALGTDTEKFSEAWMEAVRKEYWPEVANREAAEKFGRRITDHGKDGSFMNISPAVSPKGDKLAYLTDRYGYMDVVVASAIDGKVMRRLVRGEKSMQFEVIPLFRSSVTWSPDERRIAFVAKSGKGDVLYLIDSGSGRVKKKFRPDLKTISFPSWSPDGKRIALTGLKDGLSDLYLLDVDSGRLERLTCDRYDDVEASWSRDGRLIAFSSDRREPFSLGVDASRTGIGVYSIHVIDPVTREIRKVVDTGGSDRSPSWSPDGGSIVFSSSPDRTSNLYVFDLRDSTVLQLTDVLGGVFSPHWSAGDRLAFYGFSEAGYDVYVSKEPMGLKAVMEDLKREGRIRPYAAEPESLRVAEMFGGPDVSAPWPTEAGADRDSSEAGLGLLPAGGPALLPLGLDTLAATDSTPGVPWSSATALAQARDYSIRFSPDWVTGGFEYSSAYGFGGSTQLSLSDFLGNHRIYVATDFFSSFEETDLVGIYYYLPRRLDLGVGAFHYKSYYYSRTTALGEEFSEEKYFSDRNYGFMLLASYPFGRFNRVDLDLTHLSVDREFFEYDTTSGGYLTLESVSTQTRRMFSPGITFVGDTVQWGMFGPVSGSRWALSYSTALKVSRESMRFQTVWADMRKYFRVSPGYSFAFRLVGAMSEGRDAQSFFVGGAYTLRGYEDFEFVGTRVAFLNSEFRFPFIDRLGLVWPLPIGVRNVGGVLFADVGLAWSDDETFRPFSRAGGLHIDGQYGGASFGTGIRTGISFILVKLDFAWRTDFQEVSGYRAHVSFGGEF
ncbi:MAG: PD40 domain-containing protein [Candidatus Eisenbacteria bacterium]|nr:PD40 domain-containing protein [Candidatus Eisenbacteria bacterium]